MPSSSSTKRIANRDRMARGYSETGSETSDLDDFSEIRSKDEKDPRRSFLSKEESQDTTRDSDNDSGFRDCQDQLEETLQDDLWETSAASSSLCELEERTATNVNEPVEQLEPKEWLTRNLGNTFEILPDSLVNLTLGSLRCGDCGRSSTDRPDWLDMAKFRRGQKFARDHLSGVYFAELLSLFALFCFEDGLKPMIITGASSTPYTAFRRYLSTGIRVRNWYTEDPWTKGTSAYEDIQIVRKMHKNVRRRLENSNNEDIDAAGRIDDAWCPSRDILRADFQSACPAPVPGQCPYVSVRTCGLNQGEMAATQFGFVGLSILFPKAFGIHGIAEEDLEAFCHVWRAIGYLLGIEDEYNFCRGTLEDVKQRSRDFLQVWVKPNLREITPEWEHMMRCVIGGLRYYFPSTTYVGALLYFTKVLDIPMPRLHASMSYVEWFWHNVTKYIFFYASRWPAVKAFMNRRLNRAMNRAVKRIADIRSRKAAECGRMT